MIGNPNNPRREAVRKAQAAVRAGAVPPQHVVQPPPAAPPFGTRAHADQRRALDVIGGP